jgi:hypothetical protein
VGGACPFAHDQRTLDRLSAAYSCASCCNRPGQPLASCIPNGTGRILRRSPTPSQHQVRYYGAFSKPGPFRRRVRQSEESPGLQRRTTSWTSITLTSRYGMPYPPSGGMSYPCASRKGWGKGHENGRGKARENPSTRWGKDGENAWGKQRENLPHHVVDRW